MKRFASFAAAVAILGVAVSLSLSCTSGDDAGRTGRATQGFTAAATPSPTSQPSPTPTATPSPTPVPISIPPQVTLDLDPSLTEQELEYIKRAITVALKQAETDFGFATPTFTLIAYRESEAVTAKRAAWRRETVAQSSNTFPCNLCAETDTGVVLLRLGPGWFNDSPFPRIVGMSTVTHEIYHVFQISALDGKNYDPVRGPAWMMEGLAQWLAFQVVSRQLGTPWDSIVSYETGRAKGTDAGQLEKMESLRAFVDSAEPYAVALVASDLLMQGRAASDIAKFYKLLGQGRSWQDAFLSSFGIGLSDFYRKFGDRPTGQSRTISGTLTSSTGIVSSGLVLTACLFEEAQSCSRGVVNGNAFSITVPPGVYVLGIQFNPTSLRFYIPDGSTRDRTSATKIDVTSAAVTGLTVNLP